MKKLFALLMALTMTLSAGMAFAESAADTAASATDGTEQTEQADERAYYQLDELGVKLFVDESWNDAAREYEIVLELKTDYDDAGNLKSGMLILMPHAYDTSDDTQISYDVKGGIVGLRVLAEGADAATAIDGADFAEYEAIELGSANGYAYTMFRNASPAEDLLDDEHKAVVEKVIASFATAPDANFELYAPSTKQQLSALIGEFNAKDILGNAVDNTVLGNAEYTIIDVWATSCPPCIQEMPELAELAKEYEGKIQFLGVVSDASDDDTIELAKSIVDKTGVGYTCIVPDQGLYTSLLSKIQYTPTKIIVDKNGQMVGDMIIGAQSKDDLKAILDGVLAGNA